MKSWCNLVLMIFMCLLVWQEPLYAKPQEWMIQNFKLANENFRDKDYKKAIELYESILETGYQSSDLEFNLGNAYLELKELGKAILHYKRGLLLDKRHAKIKNNLQIAFSLTKDQIDVVPQQFLVWLWSLPFNFLNYFELMGVTLFFYWFSFGAILRWRKWQWVHWGGPFLLIVTIWMGSNLIWQVRAKQTIQEAVVLPQEIIVFQSPKDDAKHNFILHEGSVVRILEDRYDWAKVVLSNGLNGWVRNPAIKRI